MNWIVRLKTWWRGSLRRRLLFSSMAIVLVFLTLQGFLVFLIGRNGVRYEVDQRNRKLASVMAQDIRVQFNNIWGNILLFSYQLEELPPTMLTLEVRAMLEWRRAAPLTYRSLYLFDNDQKLLVYLNESLEELLAIQNVAEVLSRPSIPVSAEVAAAQAAARERSQLFLSPTYVVGADQVPVVYMGIPLKLAGGQQQMMVAEIDLRDIWRRVDEVHIGQTGRAFVVSREGLIIAHPDRTYIGRPLAAALRPVLDGYEGEAEYTDPQSGEIMLAAYSPVGSTSGWGIVVEQERAEVFAPVNTILWTAAVVLSLALGMAGITAWQVGQGVAAPVLNLVQVTSTIAQTNDLTQDVPVQGQDEVGRLAATFNQMIASLRAAQHKIEQYSHTLEEQVRQRTQELEAAYLDMTEQRETLDVILRSIADGLLVVDETGRVVLANPALAQFLGQPDAALIGRDAWDILPSPALRQVVNHALEAPEALATADVVLPQGSVLRASVGALGVADGKPSGVALVLRDITHDLEVDRMKTEFVSMVSHELRTPLTAVLGFAKLIQKNYERTLAPALPAGDRQVQRAHQRVGENLGIIVSEAERLTRLISDVLDIAKMEAGRIEWNITEVAPGDIVTQAVAATRALIAGQSLALAVAVTAPLPALYGDHDRLVQVVTNLLSNAIKFTDAGQIQVRVWSLAPGDDIPPLGPRYPEEGLPLPAAAPWVAVSVQDTGVGIAVGDLAQVFEKFRQVGSREAGTRRPGTGLGLPICKEIIAYHRGHLWVESRLGAGSRFVFTLPVAEVTVMEA